MSRIRLFVYGLPLLLIAVIVASFVNATRVTTQQKNEMSLATFGEPSTLNPIQQADASASEVNGMIFNGLLKVDENLETEGDLAKSWTLSQTTTIWFKTTAAAEAALAVLDQNNAQWKTWTLEVANIDGPKMVLKFAEPGLSASQKILALLKENDIRPLTIFRVEVKKGAKTAMEALQSKFPGLVERGWIESDTAMELTAFPEGEPRLKEFFTTLPEQEAVLTTLESVQFLAEPEVVFTLREDVRWHDGEPFTSRDPVFTYHAIMDDAVASPRKPDFTYILRVEAPDAYTFRVVYRKPYSPALNSWMMSLLPAHILENMPVQTWPENFNRHPIGTGAFMFSEWKTSEYIRLVRNPNYFNAPAPWLDAIVFRFLSDQLALRLAFETRQADFWRADPWAVGEFEKNPLYDIFSQTDNSYAYIGWNLRKPLFQDVQVRRALSHAVNVPEMVKYILYGRGVQSTGIFTPQMWFFNPNITPYAYDPEKARQLLDEAGWKPGPDGIRVKDGQRFSFTLITNNGNEIRRNIATLVQDDMKKIGVEVKVELYEWSVFLKNYVNKGNFDAMVLGWSVGIDYDQFQIWHSSQNNPEQLNVVSYKNEEVDKLLEEIRQEYNREKIIDMAGRMQATIYQDQPYLFLYIPKGTSVMWKDAYRIRRPDGKGGWLDSPIIMTKAGWNFYAEWFYRPEYSSQLPSAN